VYEGRILEIIKDRYGKYYAFIERKPNNIFSIHLQQGVWIWLAQRIS